MRPFLALSLAAFFLPLAALADVSFPMKYEGGSLPLELHDKLRVSLEGQTVVMIQGRHKFEVPSQSITEVSYGNDVHRRVGTAVGVAFATLGAGLMLLLVKTKKHYVGMIWSDPKSVVAEGKGGAVFKVGKGEYRGFLAALEGLSGKKAVNADIGGPGGTSR